MILNATQTADTRYLIDMEDPASRRLRVCTGEKLIRTELVMVVAITTVVTSLQHISTLSIHLQGRCDVGYIGIYTPKISPSKLFMG